jgi:CBS domain containing-hemolysin-like protein
VIRQRVSVQRRERLHRVKTIVLFLPRRAILAAIALLAAPAARASFLSGDALDTMADWLAIVVICIVPIGAIVLFWLVHILPEKVAEKRHHPQKDAITTLCLLSLAFGGLLWPIAWLWAYTRPVGYRLAYGTDKHEDYYSEMGARAQAGELLGSEIAHLREELDVIAAKGMLPPALKGLRQELDALEATALDERGQAPSAGDRKA